METLLQAQFFARELAIPIPRTVGCPLFAKREAPVRELKIEGAEVRS